MNWNVSMNKVQVAVLAILAFFVMCSTSWAANPYWVDDNGAAAWGSCQSASPLSGASACSMSTANSNASAGDTINLRTGTYGTAIAPSNSGTNNSNRITYQNYNDELVTISGLTTPIVMTGKSYITITGSASQNIIISNCENITDQMIGSDYNIFAYITAGPQSSYGKWNAFEFEDDSDYNWVHHNTFHGYGDFPGDPPNDDKGDMIGISGGGNLDQCVGNLFEDNTLYHGAHSVIAIHGKYNVVRNNYLHNEVWLNGYGGRNIIIKEKDTGGSHGWNLIDGNRIGFATPAPDNGFNDGIQMDGHDNIIRRNLIYNSQGPGIRQYAEDDNINDDNYIYNNTLFNNGLEPTTRNIALQLQVWGGRNMAGIIIKNNLFEDTTGTDFSVSAGIGYTSTNNYWSSDGDPKFTDETVPEDETDDSLPDFTLQSDSPAIDGGTYLTQANGSGSSSKTLIVDDAHYFFSGDGSPWNIPSYTGIKGDYIYVVGWDTPIEIASINYGTNTIILASAATWSNNANVYLAYSGIVGFYGSAPDIGAFEYGGSLLPPLAPAAPSDLKVK